MHMKTKWLKRLTAAALSIGMAFAPAVAGSGLTYADVKAPGGTAGLWQPPVRKRLRVMRHPVM